MKLMSCVLLIITGISAIFSIDYMGSIYSQQSPNNADPLADISSNFSFMLEPNISNNSELTSQNTQQSMNGSTLNDLALLEDQLKLAQEKIELAGLQDKDWKNYTSSSLGLSLEYPEEVAIQKEGKETRFDPYRDLKIGNIEKDGFSISPSNYGKNSTSLRNMVELAKESHLNMMLNNSYLMLVEDVTPISVKGDLGYSYLISLIDQGLEKSIFVSNNTFLHHDDNIYRFVFVTDTNQYNETNAIYNHVLDSLSWITDEGTNANQNLTIKSNLTIQNNQSQIMKTNPTSNTTVNATNNSVTIETTQGPIKIEFYPDVAPNHVKNFQDLALKGFYDGMVFHRIVPGFVIQAGDPNTKNDNVSRDSWGTGGPGYTIDQEFNNIPHERGVVSMARMPDPNSAGSQFFIVVNDSRFLDNHYTVFGKVTEGLDTVDKIANVSINSMDQPVNENLVRIDNMTLG
ncbi:peptidylprolyl isomerase [Candidatus Nitrosocosmicus hydrocola]|uniref:peptidylprolyl isomerase n=1 Tax=Candidatus Nitrosocosmicus hydrocola TaxID=1826872 RepID=UPI000A97C712|nr:peptidylprolyl isomerase [Candidatus Nitrosocosmicus hydrocola]